MRILQVGPLPPEAGGNAAGGIPTHLWALSRRLRSRGHEVAVLADNVRYRGDAWPSITEGVEVFATAGFRGTRRALTLASGTATAIPCLKRQFGPMWDLRWVASKAAAFASADAAFRPDVVHVHAPEARFPFAARLSSAPVVATVHSVHYIEFAEAARREAHRELVRRNLGLASDLVFVSRFIQEQYRELFPAEMERVRGVVVPNPLDASLYRPVPRSEARATLGLRADERVVVFVGALIPRKDAATLLEALAVLATEGRGVRALIVGEGPEEASLRALAEELAVSDLVRFEGVRPAADLPVYYSAADLFVLPSLMESFGLVFVEALLCGCPVVGTPEVLREILPGERYGIRVRPRDPSALAAAIDEGLSRRWDEGELRRYGESFDWEERIGAFERLYERLAGGPREG